MQGPTASDRLARAVDVHLRFLSGEGTTDREALLAQNEDLRDLLEGMLDDSDAGGDEELGSIGGFRLIRELGRGGMGVVYEAEEEQLGRRVALKLLPEQRALDSRGVARFLREARLAAGLDHPGLVAVHAVENHDSCHCIVMELVRGVSLQEVLARLGEERPKELDGRELEALVRSMCEERFGPQTPAAERGDAFVAAAADLVLQVAEALAHAHAAGVVHRDVKPGNILLTAEGRAVLGDFGIATSLDSVGTTLTGEFAGTPSYASPEQLRGNAAHADARSDVFSLGATLYELLAGRRPFAGTSVVEVRTRIERSEPDNLRKRNPAVPRDLAAIVSRCLEKRPEHRYAGAMDLAEDLRRFTKGEPVLARPVPWPTRTLRWMARNRLASAFLIVLAISAPSVTVLAVVAQAHARDAAARLVDFRYLKAAEDLRALLRAVDEPIPAWQQDAERLGGLLADARGLLERRAGMRKALVRLRAEARPLATTDKRRTTTPHPDEAAARQAQDEALVVGKEIAFGRQRIETNDRNPPSPEQLEGLERREAELRARAARLEQRVARRRLFALADGQEQFLHDTLEDIVAGLDSFEEQRLQALVRRHEHATIEAGQASRTLSAAWEIAASDVKASGKYGSLVLHPQTDLVPLGRDPQSGLLEFAHPPSGSLPIRREDGRLVPAADAGIVFVLLPGGTAKVGAQRADPGADHFDPMAPGEGGEEPVHAVELAPFFIGKHELTHAQWLALRATRPDVHDEAFELTCRPHWQAKPIIKVSWTSCDTLLRAHGLSLPTEVQWEYAARAGTSTRYFGGDAAETLRGNANIAGTEQPQARVADRAPFDDGVAGRATAFFVANTELDVNKRFRPNPFGLLHVLGNVSEWCADQLVPYAQPAEPETGRRAGGQKHGDSRVLRGGSYMEGLNFARVSKRSSASPELAHMTIGLRPARSLRGEPKISPAK